MWFIISLLVDGACVLMYYFFIKSFAQFQKVAPEVQQIRPAILPHETTYWYTLKYTGVFRSQNLASVFSIMTDTLYHTISTTIQAFNKLGIRKEIDVDPYPGNTDYETDGTLLLIDGKTDVSSGSIDCNYIERYIDSTTGAVLHEHTLERNSFTLSVTRSAARTGAEDTYCMNCGAPMTTGGELFICKHCGTTYRSDSYDWVISSAQPTLALSATTKLARVYSYGAIILVLALPILSLFAGGRPWLGVLIALGCLVLLASTIYLILWSKRGVRGLQALKQYDPLASNVVVDKRAAYLMRRMYHAHDFGMAEVRPMMDAAAYAQMAASQNHSGNYVVDMLEAGLVRTDFAVQDGRQYLMGTFQTQLLVLTPQRQIIQVPKQFNITLYRNESARYEHMLHSQSYTCTGCGASLNLTANGNCKYCGIEYDLAAFDWKLAYVDGAAFV